jgi:arginyl-tRNA synthetase
MLLFFSMTHPLACLQGDWGTQFGMLIQHIAETRAGGLEGTTTEEVADLQKLYKASKKRFDDEDDFKARAREAVTRLQSGDPAFEEVRCCALVVSSDLP